MSQLLHLRLGRFFERRALGQADGMSATLEMTARLDEMAHRACRAIEWRSATEAWLDLGTGCGSQSPWAVADQLRAAVKDLLPVEVACGVAGTKRASRAASALAAPSGLLVVLPGYESSILAMASRTSALFGDPAGDALDAAPFHPSLVPRAIVRSVAVGRDESAGIDSAAMASRADALVESPIESLIESLMRDARAGMSSLGVIASTVRVQFACRSGVREAFATLPDPTALEDLLLDAARPLARRVMTGNPPSGHLLLSLSQLIAGPAQASLFGLARGGAGFGWRYDRAGAERPRRLA